MKLSNLLEAKYAKQVTYIVQAFDPEDGDMGTYAGPFTNEQDAKKFAATMQARFRGASEDAQEYLPSYHVETLLEADPFIEQIDNHVSAFMDISSGELI
jgi:hypothetical protein